MPTKVAPLPKSRKLYAQGSVERSRGWLVEESTQATAHGAVDLEHEFVSLAPAVPLHERGSDLALDILALPLIGTEANVAPSDVGNLVVDHHHIPADAADLRQEPRAQRMVDFDRAPRLTEPLSNELPTTARSPTVHDDVYRNTSTSRAGECIEKTTTGSLGGPSVNLQPNVVLRAANGSEHPQVRLRSAVE
jgi:hypothetical protein